MRQHDKFGVVKIAPEISTSNNGHCWGSKLPPKSPIKAPIYTPKIVGHKAIIICTTHNS